MDDWEIMNETDDFDYLTESIKEFEQDLELFKNKDFYGQKKLSRKLLKKYRLRKIELEESISLLQDRIVNNFFPLELEYGKQHYEQKLWQMKKEYTHTKKRIVEVEDNEKTAIDYEQKMDELSELKLLELKLKSESKKKQVGDKIDQWIDKNIPYSPNKEDYKRVFKIVSRHPYPNEVSTQDLIRYIDKYINENKLPDLGIGKRSLEDKLPKFVPTLIS